MSVLAPLTAPALPAAALLAPRGSLARHARIVWQVALYELRKATVFRTGFLVREVLRGMNRPVVMVFVYMALVRSSGTSQLGGYSFPELVQYLVLVATFRKVLFHERGLDLAEQIFQGYVTKYLVMPVRYDALVLGRFVQYTLLQSGVALLFFAAGALAFPGWWAWPASPAAALQSVVLLLLGSFCFLQLTYILNAMAFWLDVVWTLLVAFRFVGDFVSGGLVPVSMMPGPLRATFWYLFPYWALSAPIEIFLGKLATPDFLEGLLVLGTTIVVLEVVRAAVWRRGVRQYSGSGM